MNNVPGPSPDPCEAAGAGVEPFRDLFEHAPCGGLALSASGRIVRTNRAIEALLGLSGPSLADRRFPDLLSLVGKIYYETHCAPLLRMQGRFDEVALDLVRADGSTLPVLVNAVERRDDDGRAVAIYVAVFRAVHRRRYEADLLTAREALSQLTESLEARIDEAVAHRLRLEDALRQSQKMEAVGQLTGGLAHDFNNLLTGISGNLELLRVRAGQGQGRAQLDRYVVAAQGATKRAAALTHRLLAFSRRQTLDPRPTDVNRLIADLEELLRRSVEPTVSLDVVGAADLWTALVDANQLESALLNLCINARDAMPDGGRITIETANKTMDDRAASERDLPAGHYLAVCVSDTGTGMSREVVEHAFEPFFTTKPLGVGTGLGLSMVYGFARQSGGQVRIHSEVGCGTTVCIYLPRHAGEIVEPVRTPRVASDVDAQRGRTVLVVDDEPTVRMLVVDLLGDAGYRMLDAADGASALRVLENDRDIDLLVTDVGLPGGLNGRQVADAARGRRPGLPVLFITGYADNAVTGHAQLDVGMQILTKPFAVDDLVDRVRTMLAQD